MEKKSTYSSHSGWIEKLVLRKYQIQRSETGFFEMKEMSYASHKMCSKESRLFPKISSPALN